MDTAIKVLKAAESAKVLLQKIALYKKDSAALNNRIKSKDNQITALKSRITVDTLLIRSYEKELTVLKDIRKLYDTEIARLHGELKRERWRRFVSNVLGVLGTAAGFYIGTTL